MKLSRSKYHKTQEKKPFNNHTFSFLVYLFSMMIGNKAQRNFSRIQFVIICVCVCVFTTFTLKCINQGINLYNPYRTSTYKTFIFLWCDTDTHTHTLYTIQALERWKKRVYCKKGKWKRNDNNYITRNSHIP